VIAIVLGLATSLVYGFADFFGAVSARRIPAGKVTFISGITGLIFLIALTGIFGATFSAGAVGWGIAAGFASAVAMSCLYASLAIGPISILSPVSAVVSAIVPMAFGIIVDGDTFSGLGLAALGVILVAVFLVGFVPGDDVRLPSAKGLLLGITAGAAIGVVLICLKQAPNDSGLASVILLRAVSALLLGITLIFGLLRRRGRAASAQASGSAPAEPAEKPSRGFWLAALAAGLFDSSANAFFLTAARLGTLTVVSVLTALYPLGTIILARLFLHERIAKTQIVGILLALAACSVLTL
jgi:drug/metabolite transporter (DMT)-like permease